MYRYAIAYSEKYDPQISVRTSMADYKKEERLINIPLYAVSEIGGILKSHIS